MIGELFRSFVKFMCPSDDFVVDISNVLKIENIVSLVAEVFRKEIKKYIGAGVSDMEIVVNRGAADKKSELFWSGKSSLVPESVL